MEKLLKQLMHDLQGFRNEVTERFNTVEDQISSSDKRLDNVEQQINKRFDGVDQQFNSIDKRIDGMEEQFSSIDKRIDGMEEQFSSIDKRFDGMEEQFSSIDKRFDSLEKGQEEMKEILHHTTTLMTENFTEIRKDIRIKNQDTQADIDLLFKEVEGVKRKTNKIEQKLSN